MMSEIRFITSSDEHIADQPPGFRKDSYCDAILAKLSWQGDIARKIKPDGILRGGDLFHTKAANKTTMSTLAKVSDIHRHFSCPTYTVVGNHDITRNDLDTIYGQPLGVLIKSEVFHPLKDEIFISGSMRVRVIGISYTPGLNHDTLYRQVQARDDDTYTIAVIHALAAYSPEEKIQSFFNENIFDYRDLVFKGCPDVYVFGHYHKDQGIQEFNGVQFVNLGAISRGALTFENLSRRPKISIITCNSQGISIEEMKVPCGDPADVFDLQLKQQLEKERRNLNEFISKLKADQETADSDDIHTKMQILQESDYPADLKKLMLNTLEAAEAGLDEVAL
jgi:DNA repair exonuclease SbcCD nuclease subunit